IILTISFCAAQAGAQTSPYAGGLIINEYNAVSEGKTLTTDATKPYKGSDSFFGYQLDGNGGNWIEFVVTQDHLNIQGWTLNWTNADPAPNNAGSFMFTNNPLWADLRAGTILTIRESDIGNPNGWDAKHPLQSDPLNLTFSNPSFAPDHNDWWINIDEEDPT